ncbi:MAG: MFS transporter [Deltaproteobacteria bacterium]|jgi:MFS family permease|nr:MFS transporter [Deltaproteobacteria bacterium]MBW2496524.1 MFS transporter [Deltaproteobacteria bacterium]
MSAEAPPSTPAPSTRTVSPRYAEYALWLLTVVYVVNFVDRQILAILLQAIKEDLNLADWQLGFLSGTAFGLFYATLGIPIARLADRWSRKGVVIASLAIWSGMTALCGTATGFATLLLFRVGVGVGEAGCSPPSHSLITDFFPPERLGRALGVYSLGVPAGVLVGFAIGGWLEEAFGWRQAFVVVGLPGLALALFVWATLRDPRPRATASGAATAPASEGPEVRDVVRFLAGSQTFRWVALGTSCYSFVGYTLISWTPSMLIRSYEMGTQEVGSWLSLVIGVGGGVGTFMGGWLADRWAAKDVRGRMWVASLAMAICLPASILLYTSSSGSQALAWMVLPATVGLAIQAPAYGLAQSLATPGTRATAAAVLLLCTNVTGMAIGPTITGILSDLFEPAFGAHSLRIAMLCNALMLAPAGLFFFLASRTMVADLEASARAAEREARGEPLVAS